jgi:hypothetical protein
VWLSLASPCPQLTRVNAYILVGVVFLVIVPVAVKVGAVVVVLGNDD